MLLTCSSFLFWISFVFSICLTMNSMNRMLFLNDASQFVRTQYDGMPNVGYSNEHKVHAQTTKTSQLCTTTQYTHFYKDGRGGNAHNVQIIVIVMVSTNFTSSFVVYIILIFILLLTFCSFIDLGPLHFSCWHISIFILFSFYSVSVNSYCPHPSVHSFININEKEKNSKCTTKQKVCRICDDCSGVLWMFEISYQNRNFAIWNLLHVSNGQFLWRQHFSYHLLCIWNISLNKYIFEQSAYSLLYRYYYYNWWTEIEQDTQTL